jgi:hypothetical protein
MNKIYQKNKKITPGLLLLLVLSTGLVGCFKNYNEDFILKGFMVEFDAATWQSKAPGKTYPILPTVDKGSGLQKFKVNLLGGQTETAQKVSFRVVSGESTAIEGKHFRLVNDGTFDIAPKTSTAEAAIEVLDFPAESGSATLVLELVETGDVKVSENYKRIGITISLTGAPSPGSALHTQIGPESFYNAIAIDPLYPGLSADFLTRWTASYNNLMAYSTGGRSLQSMYIRFLADQQVEVVAQYYGGGGNSLTAAPTANWIYKLELNAQGIGRFVFVSANGNGTGTRSVFAPILEDYLEKHEFKVDWVNASIAQPGRPGTQLGGFFKVGDAGSYLFGTLASIQGTAWSVQSSPVLHNILNNNGSLYTTILIDPESPAQSQDFRDRWVAARTSIEAIAGRRIHRMMLVFDDKLNDVKVVTYYNSSTGGRFIGQIRYQLKVDHTGLMKLAFVFQDANGGAARSTQVLDDYLGIREFIMSRTANPPIAGQPYVTFTRKDNPASFFIGSLGNNPVNVSQFWPD